MHTAGAVDILHLNRSSVKNSSKTFTSVYDAMLVAIPTSSCHKKYSAAKMILHKVCTQQGHHECQLIRC